MSDLRADRLGRAVRMRLAELGVSGRALSRAGYIPGATIARLFRGESLPRNVAGLERGLGWDEGAAHRVAGGGTPSVRLVIPGQPVRSDQAVIEWPRPDEDWRAAVEEAWQRLGKTRAEAPEGESGPASPGADSEWLHRRTADLPVWVADRIRGVLAEAEQDWDGKVMPDPVALADRITAHSHHDEVMRVVIEWAVAHRPPER